MSIVTGIEAATVKHPATAEPLVVLLDELHALAVHMGHDDLCGPIATSRMRTTDPRVRILVTGEPKKGMSTLVNGLIATAVSATNSHVSVPVVAEHGETPTTTLVRRTADGGTERRPIDPQDSAAALSQSPSGVIRAEFTVAHPLLAEGIVLMDAPGALPDDPTRTATVLSIAAGADVILYVSEARRDYYPAEIECLQRLQQICPTVICVLNKIDVFPQWHQIQQQNRRHLDDMGLEFPIFPISSGMRDYANRSGDRQLDIESGVPQLVTYLREQVLPAADNAAHAATVGDIHLFADRMAAELCAEAQALQDPRRVADVDDQVHSARAAAEAMHRQAVGWQDVLADGYTELIGDVDHDLRYSLRTVMRDAEADIVTMDPARRWKDFRSGMDGRIIDAITDNFALTHDRTLALADQLATAFPTDRPAVALEELHLDNPDTALENVAELEPLATAKSNVIAALLNGLRGSYGGILMVGLVTSLLEKPLINPYSIGAGILLGGNALIDDRKQRKQRRQAEAKVAVARLMDDVIFHVGKLSRDRLRVAHQTLRNHYNDAANSAVAATQEALRTAEEAGRQQREQHADRLAEIDLALAGLANIRQRADAGRRPVRAPTAHSN